MKRFYSLSTLVLILLVCNFANAQDFSNKGKDFWLCFPQHVPNSNTSYPTLSIYITSDRASSGTITMPNGAFTASFNIAAYGIQTISIPFNTNIHISNGESSNENITQILKKSIHVKVDAGKPPVVAYAQQWAGARSCATLVLPTNVLGKKYYAISFTQSGSNFSTFLARSQFQIIAVKDNTTLKITPRKNGVVGAAFTITLPTAGDMIQYQSGDGGAGGQDLTGTLIESVASASGGCVPIAVFSGSSNITLGTQSPPCSGGSYDPLWQQLYPVSTWGKSFGFVPFADYPNGVPYRVLASEDNTGVYFDGNLVAVLNAGEFYPQGFVPNPPTTTNPINIKADKPVCVAEYAQAENCAVNSVGDPDMVILNPIEQNISDITVFSSTNQAITHQWVNVLMKTTGTANFRMAKNGGPLQPPNASWQAFPTMPGYSYLKESLIGVSSARLVADSGFNAIAYGFGNFESYAYSAGTNVRDLYNQIGFVNPYGGATSPSVCKGIPSRFRISLPYQPDSMYWDFYGYQSPNVMVHGPIPDSITVVNGRNVYWFSLPTQYYYNNVGSFPVTITTYTQNTDGCGSEQDIDFFVDVYDLPIADFNFSTNGCVSSAVTFNDNSTPNGRPVNTWYWSFGDGGTATTANAIHNYAVAGSYSVKHSVITDIGCKSDTVTKVVTLVDPPVPTLNGPASVCLNSAGNVYTTESGKINYVWTVVGGTITAGGTSTSNTATVTWTSTGAQSIRVSYTDGNGCAALAPTIYNVTVNALPSPTISGPTSACLNSTGNVYTTQAGKTNYTWTVIGGTITAGGTSTSNTATVTWTSTGIQSISVNYTDANGCTGATATVFNVTVNPSPVPTLAGPASVCLNSSGNVYTTEAGKTNYTWTIIGGTITAGGTSTSNTATVTWTSAGAQSISVNYTDPNGCTGATATIYNVTVNPGPTPTINGPVSACLNAPGNVYTTQAGMTNYIWTVVGGTITAGGTPTSNTATVTWTSIGTQSIRVNYTDANGCVAATATIYNVTVGALPTPSLSGPISACLNSPGNVYSTQAGMINYTWTIVGGIITAGGTSTSNTATVTWTSLGAQSISVIYADPSGCAASTPGVFNVTVNPLPTPTLSGPSSVCLNSTGNVYTTQAGKTNYVWTVVGGNITAGGTSTSNTATVAWISAGTQSISVNYSDANGCSAASPTIFNVTVNPLPLVWLGGSASVCLNSSGNVYQTTPGMINYVWNIVGGIITAGGNSTSNTATVTWTSTGTQSISINFTDPNGCTAPSPIIFNVVVNPLPTPTLSGPTSSCLNVPGNVYTTQAGNTNYVWTVVGGTITAGGTSTSNTATVTWTSPGPQSISVNYTDANGCTAASPTVYPVTVGALPTATITPSGPTTFCAGGSVTLTASAGTSWLWSTGATTQSITVSTSGSYTVTVTIGNGCSATSTATTVVVNALPTPTLSGPTSTCVNAAGNVYTTQAGNSNYVWTVVGGTITAGGTSTSNTATVTWTATGARSISVNYTNANGCTAAAATVFNVTVNPLPSPTLSGPTSSCLNIPGNVYTTQAGNSNYAWSVVGGTITAGGTSTSNTATVTWTSSGPQSISVNYTDANGCSAASATVFNVTVSPLPVPTLNGPVSACLNSIGNVYTTQAGNTNYVWTVVGGTITAGGTSTSNTATVTWTSSGPQSISVNYTDANGCSAAAATVFNVTVNPLPAPAINGPVSACLNSTGNVYTTQAGNTNYTWTVVGGTITAGGTSTSNTATVTWTTTGTQSLSINYIDANGCTAAAATVFNVTVKPLPTATISGTAEACLNTPASITFTGANGTAPYTFIYKINGGPNQTISTTGSNSSVILPVPTGTAGTFTYTLVSVQEGSTNACSQAQAGTTTVIVNPLPTANFNTSVPACATNSITFTDASLPNAGTLTRWTWDYGDGNSAVLTNGNPFTHVYTTAGTYNVTLTVESSKGCISTVLIKPVIVNVRPRADFATPVVCVSDPVATFTDASQITAGSVTAWNWSFDDGGTSTQQNPSHPFSVAGNHSVQLIVTSNQGCKDTISHSFMVNGNPTANYTIQNQNALCSNQIVNITDGSSITAGSIIRTEIYWDYNNDPTIKDVDNSPVIGRSYTHTYPEFGLPASKTVAIRYVTYSGVTCLSVSTKTVTLLATPTLQFDAVTPVCSNAASFQITQAQILNALPGTGAFSGPGVSPTGFFDVAAAGSGSHTIRYTYNATNGCSNYIEQIVRVNPTPTANAGPDKVVLEGGVVQLTPSLPIGGPPVTYLWSPSTGLSDPTNPYANASPAADITYTLTVTSDQGCTSSDQVFVKLLKAPVIPNIFSPNNDGVHDKWEINYLNTYPGCTVDIYNRYGQLIFHSVGYSTPWDGTVHGTPVPVGTYYYIVDPKNGRKKMAGYVDVIR